MTTDSKKTENQEEEPKPAAEEPTNEAETPAEPDPKQRCEELEKELLYLRAEFENFKRRLTKEKEQAIQFSNERFVQDLLPIYNDFERALAHSKNIEEAHKDAADIVGFVGGVKMTYREMTQRLTKMGVEFVGNEGETFDPQRHEALSQIDAPDDKVNTVVQVIQKGCKLNGRLLNPAKVVVGKKAETAKDEAKN